MGIGHISAGPKCLFSRFKYISQTSAYEIHAHFSIMVYESHEKWGLCCGGWDTTRPLLLYYESRADVTTYWTCPLGQWLVRACFIPEALRERFHKEMERCVACIVVWYLILLTIIEHFCYCLWDKNRSIFSSFARILRSLKCYFFGLWVMSGMLSPSLITCYLLVCTTTYCQFADWD